MRRNDDISMGWKAGGYGSSSKEALQLSRALNQSGSPHTGAYPVTDSGIHHKINRKAAKAKKGGAKYPLAKMM